MAVTGHAYASGQALADEAVREFILLRTDYWIRQVSWRDGKFQIITFPSVFAQRFRMLAHFRALDRDDD